jgi:hypothetical protein
MLVLPEASPEVSVDVFMFDMSPDVFVLRRVLLLRRPRLRRCPPVFDDVLPFCEVIIPPRVCSSVCVVEELEFCAETIRSALTRATEITSMNKTVMLRVMLLLLTDVSPF